MSICHAEKVVTDPVWAHRRPALFFHFLQHFLSSRVQSKGFYLALCKCCQLILSGPAPRFQSLGSLPLVFSTLCSLPACPHACAALVFTPSPCAFCGGPGWRWPQWPIRRCRVLSPGPLLALHLWKHTCFALLPVQMLDKETDCLILSLAQSWRADFWNFSTCESPFLGFICSVSCPPMRHLDCFFYCFSVPFPQVVYFL